MATRRLHKVGIDVPIPPRSPTSTPTPSSSPTAGSPFLPTLLEAALLAIYPATLLLGSIFSLLHPASRHAPYSPTTQSYDPRSAPSYFAKKSNIFNVYFVKIGWFWTTLAFFVLVFTHASHGPVGSLRLTRRRGQAIARYAAVTGMWVLVTQWCFGPGIVDRSFRWTGGKCDGVLETTLSEKIVGDAAMMGEGGGRSEVAKDVFTHAACKAVGGQWKGGHDISGHVFLLILGSAMLWLELLPAVLRSEGLGEKRRIRTADGLTRNASLETADARDAAAGDRELGLGIKTALTVAGLSWWMLLMTAAFFHTWFEKVTGLLVAFSAIYTVYFLPRGVPLLRQVLGLPGV